ncbi:MAG: HlyD family efflux transporter periplasmic adaptor subunit [Planctomycetales bacterium]
MNARACLFISTAAAMLTGCGAGRNKEAPPKLPRPVSVIILKQLDPRDSITLTGSVTSWKEEQIGFQVAGRIESILEPGVDVLGRTFDEERTQLTEGEVIAELEKDRFDLKLASAQAVLDTAVATANAAQADLDNVLPQEIKAAEAEVAYQQEELARNEELVKTNNVTKSEFERVKANRDRALALLAQRKASTTVKEAEVKSLRAQVSEAEESVKQAELDLQDTKLVSPFHGQIAKTHQIPGAFVQQGQAVVTVQMMLPIKVEVAVSAETDRSLNYNDLVNVYVPDEEHPVEGFVYLKDTIADSATRTFTVTLLVRNRKIEVGLPEDAEGSEFIRTRGLSRLARLRTHGKTREYLDVDCVHKDDSGHYVWKVENLKSSDRRRGTHPKLILKKVRVQMGDDRIPLLQAVVLREVADGGELKAEEDLIAGPLFGPDRSRLRNVEKLPEGMDVYFVRERWSMRPGDIVNVDLDRGELRPGFYVPMDVIVNKSGEFFLFLASKDGNSVVAKRTPITVHESLNGFRRVEPAGSEGFPQGASVIAEGVHYLVDGEKVVVSRTRERKP